MGAVADRYYDTIKRIYPAAIVTAPRSEAFYRGLATLAERLEVTTGSATANWLIKTAGDIWLKLIAQERGTDYGLGADDTTIRAAIQQDRDTVTPNGMTAAVDELVDLYAVHPELTPSVDEGQARNYNAGRDGGWLHDPAAGKEGIFLGHHDAILGPEGTASFEYVLPGVDLFGGTFLHDTGDPLPENNDSAFLHDTGSGDPKVTFLTNPDMFAWSVLDTITAMLERWKANGVPAYAQLRPSEAGLHQEPYFGSLAPWVLSQPGGSSVGAIFDDEDIDGLESVLCRELTATAGDSPSIIYGANLEVLDEAMELRISASIKKTVAGGPGAVQVGIKDETSGQWLNPSTLLFQGGEILRDVAGELTLGERQTIEVFPATLFAAGARPRVKIQTTVSAVARFYHVALTRED